MVTRHIERYSVRPSTKQNQVNNLQLYCFPTQGQTVTTTESRQIRVKRMKKRQDQNVISAIAAKEETCIAASECTLIIYNSISIKNTGVIWLKHCRYVLKTIQSIKNVSIRLTLHLMFGYLNVKSTYILPFIAENKITRNGFKSITQVRTVYAIFLTALQFRNRKLSQPSVYT